MFLLIKKKCQLTEYVKFLKIDVLYVQGGSTKFAQAPQSPHSEPNIHQRNMQYGDGMTIYPILKSPAKVWSPQNTKLWFF